MDDEIYKEIGKRVAHHRNEANMSQLALSLKMNFESVSIVRSAENFYRGKHFNLQHLYLISSILKVSLSDLLPDTNL